MLSASSLLELRYDFQKDAGETNDDALVAASAPIHYHTRCLALAYKPPLLLHLFCRRRALEALEALTLMLPGLAMPRPIHCACIPLDAW